MKHVCMEEHHVMWMGKGLVNIELTYVSYDASSEGMLEEEWVVQNPIKQNCGAEAEMDSSMLFPFERLNCHPT